MVRSSSSLMARSAASARSSMLMARIIAILGQQIFTFATHRLHRGRRSSACAGRAIPPKSTRGGRAMTRRTFQKLTAVVLMVAAAGTAGLIGAPADAHGPGGVHGGMMKRMISPALDEALDQAPVTAQQRAAIFPSRDPAFAAVEAHRPDRR